MLLIKSLQKSETSKYTVVTVLLGMGLLSTMVGVDGIESGLFHINTSALAVCPTVPDTKRV